MSNEFEKVKDNRNDFIDSAVAFVVATGFFLTVFLIFTVFGVIKDFQ
ncbi:YqzM family protein [Bacillus horti]|uniref:YqzM family protein n=1 Tax=Caldalkalibacillus horti TaxID=77523 RepID=A0ABT9VTB2_9BACI|nr:YqzM family protein [Bacillus horti]MDQ0164120.1 hypothetical protein [Bacillus horti]